MKGWIALDIDGTITQDRYTIPEPVIAYLQEIAEAGWKIMFVTGRAFVFAQKPLQNLPFPFVLGVQNGSLLLEMPSQTVILKKYLSFQLISEITSACEGMSTDPLFYLGYENKDQCLFRPSRFLPEDLIYIEEMQKREKEKWIAVEEFSLALDFPLVKCFGKLDTLQKIKMRLQKSGHFHLCLIRDPFRPAYYLLLITAYHTTKGEALRDILTMKGKGSLVVAAGDDENDISLLQAADIKIAMPHAPESLRQIADFIAPQTQEFGIIHALKIALHNDTSL